MKQHAPAVSVIVPMYNVEKYLRQCLDSLADQTLRSIEFICVDDGSTDATLAIAESYAERDSRFRIISKPNGGYGETMNVGLDHALGEYVGILESDDFADKHMYKNLYSLAKRRHLDLVKANYYEHSEKGDVLQEPFTEFQYRHVYDPRESQGLLTALPIIWSALYRRDMLVDNHIRFNETPGASYQDTSFVQQVWMCARRVMIVRRGYIHYRVDNANSSVKSDSKVFSVCDEYAFTKAFMERNPELFEHFGKIINLLKLGTYRWNYNRITEDYHHEFAKRISKEYRDARENGSLDSSYFTPQDWLDLELLMDDPDEFVVKHSNAW